MENNKIHIGSLIKDELKKQERSMAWLARQIGYDQRNFSKTLQLPHINTDTLLNICNTLNYDFFAVLSKSFRRCKNTRKTSTQNT
jgi:lambda repressor-like predicted transcriptional regulator